jgi:hypothetical protein
VFTPYFLKLAAAGFNTLGLAPFHSTQRERECGMHAYLLEGVPKVDLTKCRFIDELKKFHSMAPKRVFALLQGKSDFIQFWRSFREALHI